MADGPPVVVSAHARGIIEVLADPYLWALLVWLLVVAAIVHRITREPWTAVGSRALGMALTLIGVRWAAAVEPELLWPIAAVITGSALVFWPRARSAAAGDDMLT